jgi:hypothetical protein
MSDAAFRVLRFLVKGDTIPFKVIVPIDKDIEDLKEDVREKGVNIPFAKDLILWKASSWSITIYYRD